MTAAVPNPDAQMLARLAEMDMSAAEHVHAHLVAATAPDQVADLSRAYQRMSRSLRQTLALKAKLAREAAQAQARATVEARWGRDDLDAYDPEELPFAERITALQDAVGRIAHATVPDEDRREALLDRFDVELDDWEEAEDFLTADLDAQVLRACRLLDLPEDLAPRWRDLPDPHAEAAAGGQVDPPPPDSGWRTGAVTVIPHAAWKPGSG